MNVDFLASFASFEELTEFHRNKLWYPDKEERPRILRAGRFGYHVKETDPDFDKICKWCREQAHKVEESIPEDLVVA